MASRGMGLDELPARIERWAAELGFSGTGGRQAPCSAYTKP